jgi:hypothetical protein
MSAVPVQRVMVLFTAREICNMTGLSYNTLKWWLKNKLLQPAVKGSRGSQYGFNAWQACALAVLSAALNDKRDVNSYVGRTGVLVVINEAAKYDDEMLLRESDQSPHIAEKVAAEIARAVPSEFEELSDAMLENLAIIVHAIDRKARLLRESAMNRLR